MSCIKASVLAEPLVDFFDKKSINSSICRVFEVDLYTVKKEELDYSNEYELTFFRKDTVHAFAAWFDCHFDKLPNKVTLSTSPFNRTTHWKQTIFYTEKDFIVEPGEILKGSIAVRKGRSNFRELDIKISFHFDGKSGAYNGYQLFKLR